MNFSRIFASISNTLGAVRSAQQVVSALESNRRPDANHLRRLGVDPAVFLSMGHG